MSTEKNEQKNADWRSKHLSNNNSCTELGEVKGCGNLHRTITKPSPEHEEGICWFCCEP